MTWLVGLVRRSVWLLLIGAVGGALYAWWRDRTTPAPAGPAEWPPLEPPSPAPEAARSSASAETASEPAAEPEPGAEPGDGAATSSVVNALVDAPEARSAAGGTDTWVAPDDAGACPVTHPIKANDNSGIYHVPGGRFYDRTRAERCYATAEAAEADGYRKAKS